MTEGVLVAIIMSGGTLLSSLITLYVTVKNKKNIDEVHKATNSMKDALVAAALIEGERIGKEKAERLK